MAPRTYAIDLRTDSTLPALFVWSFDSPWLRAAALKENPGTLRAVMRAEVAHRVLRAHRRGDWRDVAPGVRVYLHDPLPPDHAFPAVPRLRLPNPREDAPLVDVRVEPRRRPSEPAAWMRFRL